MTEPQSSWRALYTRARHEKQVARLLAERVIETYLPLVAQQRRWSDRLQTVDMPLFSSYVFARFSTVEVHAVLELPGVQSIVRHGTEFAAVAEAELENLRRYVAALTRTGVPTMPRPVPLLQVGQEVEIMDGPFAGVRGQVRARRNARRVVVGLHAIAQGFEINVTDAQLRALSGAEPT